MNFSFLVVQLMSITAAIAILVKLKKIVDDPNTNIKRTETGSVHILHTVADIMVLGLIGGTLGYGVWVIADAYTGNAAAVNGSLLSAVSGLIGLVAPKVWELAIEVSEYIAEKVRDKLKKKTDEYIDD